MVPCFPLLGLTPSGLFMGLSSTIIYTSELILCSTIFISERVLGPYFHMERKFKDVRANIDFFLKILPLKDDELVMSEI